MTPRFLMLTVAFWISLLGGVIAAAVALRNEARRTSALFLAAGLFTIAGTLSVFSVGYGLLALAVVCGVAGLVWHNREHQKA